MSGISGKGKGPRRQSSVKKASQKEKPIDPLLITIGPQCAGKTTFLKKLNAVDITIDDIPQSYAKIPILTVIQQYGSTIPSALQNVENHTAQSSFQDRNVYGISLLHRLQSPRNEEHIIMTLVLAKAISWPQAHEKLSIIIKDTALVDCLSAVVLEILSESHEEFFPTIDLFIGEAIPYCAKQASAALDKALNTVSGCVSWGNTNLASDNYASAIYHAALAKRPVRFVRWGRELPLVGFPELLRRNLLRFIRTGRYIPAGVLQHNIRRAESFLGAAGPAAGHDYFARLAGPANHPRVPDDWVYHRWTNDGEVASVEEFHSQEPLPGGLEEEGVSDSPDNATQLDPPADTGSAPYSGSDAVEVWKPLAGELAKVAAEAAVEATLTNVKQSSARETEEPSQSLEDLAISFAVSAAAAAAPIPVARLPQTASHAAGAAGVFAFVAAAPGLARAGANPAAAATSTGGPQGGLAVRKGCVSLETEIVIPEVTDDEEEEEKVNYVPVSVKTVEEMDEIMLEMEAEEEREKEEARHRGGAGGEEATQHLLDADDEATGGAGAKGGRGGGVGIEDLEMEEAEPYPQQHSQHSQHSQQQSAASAAPDESYNTIEILLVDELPGRAPDAGAGAGSAQ